jgi:hypothetical protein
VVLTVDNLSLLQVLLQEFYTAIDTALDLVIGAYLHGYVVSGRMSATSSHMSVVHHCGSEHSLRLTVQQQLTPRGSDRHQIQRWEHLV